MYNWKLWNSKKNDFFLFFQFFKIHQFLTWAKMVQKFLLTSKIFFLGETDLICTKINFFWKFLIFDTYRPCTPTFWKKHQISLFSPTTHNAKKFFPCRNFCRTKKNYFPVQSVYFYSKLENFRKNRIFGSFRPCTPKFWKNPKNAIFWRFLRFFDFWHALFAAEIFARTCRNFCGEKVRKNFTKKNFSKKQ